MKNDYQHHSNAPTNRDALYPNACNSPLRFKSIADDEESDASDNDDNDSGE